MKVRSGPVGLLATLLFVSAADAQTRLVVEGRVVERGGAAIPNAQVELDGYPATMTGPAGEFRFERVEPGGYGFRVTALGYAPRDLFLVIRRDTAMTLELERAPLRLDTLFVEGRAIDVRGRVTEQGSGLNLFRVEVRTNLNRSTETNTAGRFRLRDVPVGPALALELLAFGFMPFEAVVRAEADTTLAIEMQPDPLVQRMIAVEVGKLEQRSRPFRSSLIRPFDRADLLRRSNGTVLDVVKSQYGLWLNRLKCIVIDEKQDYNGLDALALFLPAEIERIEVFERGAMLRIYTRDFIRSMLGGGIELRPPLYLPFTNPPVCR